MTMTCCGQGEPMTNSISLADKVQQIKRGTDPMGTVYKVTGDNGYESYHEDKDTADDIAANYGYKVSKMKRDLDVGQAIDGEPAVALETGTVNAPPAE